MASSFSIRLGNFLYKNSFPVYKALYSAFKRRQDKFEISLLKQHIRPGDTVLDIGANIGFYATILSELTGNNGKVHCFEPDPVNFSHLEDSTQNLKNIVINNKAVGPKTETLKIYTSKNLNVDHRTYKPEEYDAEIEISAVSVDDYLGANNKVNFIKMDIQGFELQAVHGMRQTLKANPELKMISEFWPYGLKRAGSSALELYNFFIANGFTCQLLEENSLSVLNEQRVKALMAYEDNDMKYYNILATRNV